MSVLSTPLTELLSATTRSSITSSTAELSELMRRLEPAPEPAEVFKSLTRIVVPLLCASSSVWICTAGEQPSQVSFRVTDSDGCDQRACESAKAGSPTPAEPAALLAREDTVVVPINPSFTEGQVPYQGAFTMSFHGSRPTLTDVLLGHLLVERAISLVQREQLASKIDNLHRALHSNREIGAAMGILMATHKLTSDQAFDLLRRTSQRVHRKIALIAADVIETGVLERPGGVDLLEHCPMPGPPRRRPHLRVAR